MLFGEPVQELTNLIFLLYLLVIAAMVELLIMLAIMHDGTHRLSTQQQVLGIALYLISMTIVGVILE